MRKPQNRNQNQNRKPVRQSNFELLRIFFMVMIVANHLRNWGELLTIKGAPGLSRILLLGIGWGGKAGVVGFVLISGYFSCTARTPEGLWAWLQGRRVLRLAMQVLFYSAGGFLLALAMGWNAKVGLASFSRYFLPLTGSVYWFATMFVLLLLCTPYLNLLLQKLEKPQARALLLTAFAVFSLLPSLYRVKYETPRFVWFLFAYLLGGYMRLHPPRWSEKKWKWPALGVAAAAYALVAYYPMLYAGAANALPFLRVIVPAKLAEMHHVPVLFCALGLFLFFKNLEVKPSRAVNAAAGAMFGVYLFHEHPILRQKLWLDWFDCRPYYAQPLPFLGRALWAVAAVFLLGLGVELIRIYALEQPLFKQIDKRFDRKEGQA